MKHLLSLLTLAAFALATVPPVQAIGLQGDTGAATAAAGAATLNKTAGAVTSEALTTAAGAAYTLTLTDDQITADSILIVNADNGTNTTAGLAVGRITPAAGSAVILIWNRNAAAALNGTVKIRFAVVK